MEDRGVLTDAISYIEENIGDKLTIEEIAGNVYISPVHLQRMFSFVFDIPIAEYVRSRKLQKSLELLYDTGEHVDDIAYDVGFGHESSFIRSFKREFGVTPNEVRKKPHILQITPPINMDEYKAVANGMLSDMDFVMIPKMTLVGRSYVIPFADSQEMAPEVAVHFWQKEAPKIKHNLNDNVYIGLTHLLGGDVDYSFYIPSVIVDDKADVPRGMVKETIPSTMGVRFKYIGHHHYYDINARVASEMYKQIDKFMTKEHENYFMPNEYYFEKIDVSSYDGEYCMMEWYTPIVMLEDLM